MLDIDNKLNVVFDLFPKSSPQQNQIKSMVIAKAKCKGKKSAPPRREGSLYIHGTVPIYMGTHRGPSYSHVLLVSTCLHLLLMAI